VPRSVVHPSNTDKLSPLFVRHGDGWTVGGCCWTTFRAAATGVCCCCDVTAMTSSHDADDLRSPAPIGADDEFLSLSLVLLEFRVFLPGFQNCPFLRNVATPPAGVCIVSLSRLLSDEAVDPMLSPPPAAPPDVEDDWLTGDWLLVRKVVSPNMSPSPRPTCAVCLNSPLMGIEIMSAERISRSFFCFPPCEFFRYMGTFAGISVSLFRLLRNVLTLRRREKADRSAVAAGLMLLLLLLFFSWSAVVASVAVLFSTI